jgi:uncharacterized tellurite resistance protein B-like protein
MLLDRFKTLWEELTAERGEQESERRFELAAAALMLEVMRADFQQTDDERQVALQLLRDTFALSDAELQQLEANATEEVDASTSLHSFVRTINDTADFDDKVQLVESLWRVAYADGDLDKYEEHLIRRIADLIYLPHDAFIRAKLSAI